MKYMLIMRSTDDSWTEDAEGDFDLDAMLETVGRFNEELVNAGVLLAAEGLHPSSQGARVTSESGTLVVKDGPFAETKELIAGFWVISVKSRDEAVEWVKRIPFEDGETIELRRVFEAADFAEIVPQEAVAKEQAWRDATQKPITN